MLPSRSIPLSFCAWSLAACASGGVNGANPGAAKDGEVLGDDVSPTVTSSADFGDEPSAEVTPSASSEASEPYANVVAVSTSGSDGALTFSVSVESADVDCSQYANWWEVLDEDGGLLYRRILVHSHTDENGTSDADAPGNTFTRSGGPVNVASDAVVHVRAHMSVGGYRGDVQRGTAATGFAKATDLEPDFATAVERLEPQPDGCQF